MKLPRLVPRMPMRCGSISGRAASQAAAKRQSRTVWVTAAIGMAVGVGFIWPALVAVILGWLILYMLHHCERWVKQALRDSPGKLKRNNDQEDSACKPLD